MSVPWHNTYEVFAIQFYAGICIETVQYKIGTFSLQDFFALTKLKCWKKTVFINKNIFKFHTIHVNIYIFFFHLSKLMGLL